MPTSHYIINAFSLVYMYRVLESLSSVWSVMRVPTVVPIEASTTGKKHYKMESHILYGNSCIAENAMCNGVWSMKFIDE